MSAKHSKKSAHKPVAAVPAVAAAANAKPQSTSTATPAAPETTFTPWIDSSDPRRRKIGKIVLIGVWIYVAALWLLALDQTFDWGIFGPKTPPALP